MLSGLYPRTHGIIDNDWWDRELGRRERATEDSDFSVVGLDPGSDTSGPSGSPRQFHGTTLVDWLRRQDGRILREGLSGREGGR